VSGGFGQHGRGLGHEVAHGYLTSFSSSFNQDLRIEVRGEQEAFTLLVPVPRVGSPYN
jgi:hypothetical protein